MGFRVARGGVEPPTFRFSGGDVELVDYQDYHAGVDRVKNPVHPAAIPREEVLGELGFSVSAAGGG